MRHLLVIYFKKVSMDKKKKKVWITFSISYKSHVKIFLK